MITVSFTIALVLGIFSVNSVSAADTKQIEFECVPTIMGEQGDSVILPFIFQANVPEEVYSGQEFYIGVSVVQEHHSNDGNITFGNAKIKINSENGESTATVGPLDHEVFLPDLEEGPPFIQSFTGDSGVEIGPFIAGEEGEVVLKADEFSFAYILGPKGTPAILANFDCNPVEGADATIGTVPIVQDTEAPVITLIGDDMIELKRGDTFEDPGATAKDNVDGDLTDKIVTSGEVDTSKNGTYTITYTVTDAAGNESTVERTVNVVEPYGSWYTGEGPPSDELGSNGDSYLDITTGDVYKRDPNTWNKVGNLKGDDGKQGSSILTGSGAPSATAGDIGDLYLDTKTGDVYEKTVDGWKKVANLQGPAGPQGPKGSTGSGGGSGAGGDGDGKQPGTGKKSSVTKTGDGKGTTTKGGKLPKTATSLPTLILIGTLIATAGGAIFLRRRKAIN